MTRATVLTAIPPKTKVVPMRKSAVPDAGKQRIGEMLTYRRPHNSPGEKEFVERYILPLKPVCIADRRDTIHAYTVRIPGSASQSARAFCAHVDSVHNRQNPTVRQTIGYDAHADEFFVNNEKQRDCLGADDAAGCYVLLRMIEANVPGLYVFFRGEELGGIGSSYVKENRQDVFDGITQAIQFDRRGTTSIITQMMCGKTCSDTYARALGAALGMGHTPDDSGSFTDTANLAGFVAECTNVSVGYEYEHSSSETLNAGYLVALADRCVAVFADAALDLPIERKPGEFRDDVSPRFGRSSRDVGFEAWIADKDEGIYVPEFGQITVYDLPNLTVDDLLELGSDLSVEDIAALLYQAGEAIAEAFPTYYDLPGYRRAGKE